MTNEEYARFLKTWDWAEFEVSGGGVGESPARLVAPPETSEFGAVQTEAGGTPQKRTPQGESAVVAESPPAAPIQPGAGDVGQGDLLPSKAGTAEEASASPAPTQGALL